MLTARLVLLAAVLTAAPPALSVEGSAGGSAETTATPPNIILIISDDHGYRDHGFMGSRRVHTPNLDALAREGTVFTNGFLTAAHCRPSLRSLLWGVHPYEWRLRAWGTTKLRRAGLSDPIDLDTLPGLLAKSGYSSFMAGKFVPLPADAAGFDEAAQAVPGRKHPSEAKALRAPLEPALAFIRRHRERPFFLWFAPRLPHLPHDPGPRHLERYEEDTAIAPSARAYYANVTRLDDLVGRLVRAVDEMGLRERTLVVYLADNGWDQPPELPLGFTGDGDRGKRTPYETGLRTPIVFRWPGRVPAGETRDDLVSSLDLFPTLLDYAGAEDPDARRARSEEGAASLRPALEGRAPHPRDAVFVWADDFRPSAVTAQSGSARSRTREQAYVLRTDAWHYVWYPASDAQELFDARTDPDQRRDVASDHPEVAARLRARIERRRAEIEGGPGARAR